LELSEDTLPLDFDEKLFIMRGLYYARKTFVGRRIISRVLLVLDASSLSCPANRSVLKNTARKASTKVVTNE